MNLELILSFAFTLLIFSYLLGDNVLYRLAIYVFVGLTSAFTAIVTVENVIVPFLDGNPANAILFMIASVLALLLLLKPIRLFTPISNLALAFLIAVGSAVAVLGAITGTLIPLVQSTARPAPSGSLLDTVLIFVGVVTSLAYFQYVARRLPNGEIVSGRISYVMGVIGEGFIMITLGAVYGAAILSSLSVLTGHLSNLLGS
jgi:hypothetical protein